MHGARPYAIGMRILNIVRASSLIGLATLGSANAWAQDKGEPRRTRIGVGPQLTPRFPGSDSLVVRPFFDFNTTRGDSPFPFEAADESTGFPVLSMRGFEIGPAVGFEGARRTRDARGLRSVGFTVEPGAFVQYYIASPVRARIELRQGIGGHKGLIGVASLDYIARDRDDWQFAIGPRVTFANGKYQRAYFGVPVGSVAASGLPAFDPGGGIEAVGGTAGYLKQLTPRWGIYAFGKYDRLIDDAGNSPVVRRYGSRDQLSGGLALTYTFSSGRD